MVSPQDPQPPLLPGYVQVFQSALRPAALMSSVDITRVEQGALQFGIDEARKDSPNEAVWHSRALLPSDLAETNENWGWITGTSPNVWEVSLINEQQIADNKVIMLYGLVDTSRGQYISGIRIRAGSARRYQFSTFDYFSDDITLAARTAYFNVPIALTKQQFISIDYYILGAGGTQQSVQIAYKGWVIEKPGVVLTP